MGRRTKLFTAKDMDFIAHTFDEHIRLAKQHIGCTWEHSAAAEKAAAYRVIKNIGAAQYGTIPLDGEDFAFIQFVVEEHCDFANEGIAQPWGKTGQDDSIKASHVLRKLQLVAEPP